MITSLTFKSGFAKKLLGNRRFAFGPGLNVLVGENGCGKTTMLRTMGAYAGCPGNGWSGPLMPFDLQGASLGSDSCPDYPERFSLAAPGKVRADVAWDGGPCFLSLSSESDRPMATSVSDFDSSLMGMREAMTRKFAKLSSGQTRLDSLGRALSAMKDIPDIRNGDKVRGPDGLISRSRVNDHWLAYALAFDKYLETLPGGSPTLLLDEPDRSLDPVAQAAVWNGLARFSKDRGIQVVASTHSVYALRCDNVRVTEVRKGFLEDLAKVDRIFGFPEAKLKEDKKEKTRRSK